MPGARFKPNKNETNSQPLPYYATPVCVCLSLPPQRGLETFFAIFPASESTCEYPVSTSLFPLLTI